MNKLREAVRWAQLMAGLAAYGIAIALLVRSGLGLGPWDAFHVGLSELTGMSLGVVLIAVGIVIIVGTLFIGVRPGPGTILNMILIGVFVDLLLPFIPEASPRMGLPYHLSGIALTGIATGLYIAPRLGKGPRDGLMIGIAERTGWPVGRVRTGIEVSVLVAGWLMGGRIGFGTLLFAFTIGPATAWGLRLFGAEKGAGGGFSEGVTALGITPDGGPLLPLPAPANPLGAGTDSQAAKSIATEEQVDAGLGPPCSQGT